MEKLEQYDRNRIQSANTAMEVLEIANENGIDLAAPIAEGARRTAIETLRGAPVEVDVVVTDRRGKIIGRAS